MVLFGTGFTNTQDIWFGFSMTYGHKSVFRNTSFHQITYHGLSSFLGKIEIVIVISAAIGV